VASNPPVRSDERDSQPATGGHFQLGAASGIPHAPCGPAPMSKPIRTHTVRVMLEQAINSQAKGDTVLADLPAPVRRYLRHALPGNTRLPAGVRLSMTGKIKVGCWLPFTAEQDCDGRSFKWHARVGRGPLKPLEVVDRYADGVGSVTGWLLGRFQLFHDDGQDIDRSAAGRAAMEAVFAPASLLPGRGVDWSVKDEDNIVATSYPGHEEINVHLQIGGDGALRSVRARRWGQIRRRSHCYLTFGGDMHAEQRFGDLIIPSRFTVGWRYGTPDYDPFFQAHIRAAQPQP
jgi:hypothetical protein